MDFLLSSGSDRREKEAVARREAAKEKKRVEAERAEEQARVERQYEELRKARKEEEAKAAEEKQRLENEEIALTGGLAFTSHGLRPYRIEGEDDKVVLPEAALVDLNQADAFSRGPALLRIWSSRLAQDIPLEKMDVEGAEGGSSHSHFYSHCGIREFSALPGTIGLPDKVIHSLLARCGDYATPSVNSEGAGGEQLQAQAELLRSISIKYVTMPKASYVCFRPLLNAFQAVGPVKQCLEENLVYHSTLSVGDLVTVWYRGKAHPLRVTKMLPGAHGTLLQADVEVDIDVSEEYASKAGNAQAEKEKGGEKAVVPAAKTASSFAAATSSTSTAVAVVFPADPAGAEEPLELPEEPALEEKGVVACRLRVPSGATLARRYRMADPLSAVFELAARSLHTRRDGITLSTRFPPRTFDYSAISAAGQTLEQAGITSSQEVFMVTVI